MSEGESLMVCSSLSLFMLSPSRQLLNEGIIYNQSIVLP